MKTNRKNTDDTISTASTTNDTSINLTPGVDCSITVSSSNHSISVNPDSWIETCNRNSGTWCGDEDVDANTHIDRNKDDIF